ncbi:MAG: DUF881 domain-containing protein [Clostridia bacterium]|nr:DUF881 domain-containing protein [Clostridia bacterium]
MEKRNKIIFSIILGVVCFILTMVIFLQFKTISQTDIISIESMREEELKQELSTYKTKYDEVVTKLEENNKKILEYEKSLSSEEEATNLINKELEESNDLIGKNSVQGEGIIITLTDTKDSKITANDLLTLMNELKQAGAEAISINDQRIVYNTYIVDINYTYISVNGKRIVSPYVVKAIGNTTYLESALSQKQYGYIDKMLAAKKSVVLERQSLIDIANYTGDLSFEYVKEEK